MAVGKSGYLDVTCMPQNVGKVRVYWREDYDSINNYSTITVTDIQGYLWHKTGWAYIAVKVTAGDVTVMNSNEWMFSANADTTLRSVAPRTQWDGTFTPVTSAPIYHNDDGTKNITLTFTLVDITCSTYNGTDNLSASQTVALTSIPRASTISATDANIEAVSSIAVNRRSSAYTHSIQYRFGSLSGYINADGSVSSAEIKLSATSIGFAIPSSFYAQIPNSKTGTCTLTIKTYSGETQIGDAKTCIFTVMAAEANCAPTVSGTVIDINEATLALTGDENKLIRFFSNVLATITATAKNSASIASKAIAGVEVTEDSRTINAVETDSFVFGVTDSRGYSDAVTVTQTLIEYIKLTCNMSVARDDPTSGDATLVVKGGYFNGSFGAVDNSLTVQYRIGEGDWISVAPTLDGNTYAAIVALSGLDYQSYFDIEVNVVDKLTSATKSQQLNKGIPNFHQGENDVTFEIDVNVNGNTSVGGALTVEGNLTINGGLITALPVAPRNLLDNSDFTNPVNQRVQTNFTGNGYTIDRWYLWSDDESANFNYTAGYVALNPYSASDATLSQRFPKGFFTANSYTLAYCDSNDNVVIDNNPIKTTNDGFDHVQILFTEWIGVKWVALYEGEYTAETLPPYVPKGYGAELVACLRYFERIFIREVQTNIVSFYLARNYFKKRVNPTITFTQEYLENIAANIYLWNITPNELLATAPITETYKQTVWYGYADISADI